MADRVAAATVALLLSVVADSGSSYSSIAPNLSVVAYSGSSYNSITPVMPGWVVVVNTLVLFVQAGATVRLYSTVYCDCLTFTV